MIFDEVVYKQIGYMIVGIWGVFSPVIAQLLAELDVHWTLILFLTGSWVFADIFIAFYIHYWFKIDNTGIAEDIANPSTVVVFSEKKEEQEWSLR